MEPVEKLEDPDYGVLRQKKQAYLLEEIVNKGFDTSEFTQFMELKKGKLTTPTLLPY